MVSGGGERYFTWLLRLNYIFIVMGKLRNHNAELEIKTSIRKTTIELTEEQYFFLKEKPWNFRSRIRMLLSCPSYGIWLKSRRGWTEGKGRKKRWLIRKVSEWEIERSAWADRYKEPHDPKEEYRKQKPDPFLRAPRQRAPQQPACRASDAGDPDAGLRLTV